MKRFSAVDGSKLDVMNDTRISLHTRQNIYRKFRRSHYEINTPGAIGASLSHIGIWKEFLASDAPYVVVFEDDTVIPPEQLKQIDELAKQMPMDWDLWLLGCHAWAFRGQPMKLNEPKGWWNVYDFTGAHAYVLSRRGAEILLAEPFPIETHIEYYMCACAQLKGLNIVRHASCRVRYSAEIEQEQDSDTFDSRKSCPVCYVPDRLPEVGFYMSYKKFSNIVVGLAALGFIGYAYKKSQK